MKGVREIYSAYRGMLHRLMTHVNLHTCITKFYYRIFSSNTFMPYHALSDPSTTELCL